MAEKNKTTRKFSYTRPILYNGESYPSAEADITYDGTTMQGRIFADANGQYYTMDSNNNVLPVMPVNELDEVTVTAPKKDILAGAFNRYLTRTDNTRVNNLPHREYNTQLKEDAERGAREHAIWDKEHPNLAAWGTVASAIPFAVAAAPFIAGGGSALLSTTAGQAARSGIAALMSNPIVEVANNAIGLGFAGKGAYDVSQGKFTPETAMDLAGGATLLGKDFNFLDRLLTAKKSVNRLNAGSDITPNTGILPVEETIPNDMVNSNWQEVDLGDLSSYNPYPLKGKKIIPMNIREEAARKYTDFINSDDYQSRLQRAGLENHWNYIKSLTDERVNNKYYFPGKVQPIINNSPRTEGISDIDPESLNYGVTLKEDLPSEKIMPTLMHEVAHWATGNAGNNALTNFLFNPVFQFKKGAKDIRDIMKYNEDIVPNIPWKEVKAKLPQNMPKEKIARKKKYYKYLIDPQEKRARAMSIYQQAKDKNMTTDEFIDMYTDNGKIAMYAPEWLRNMGTILTTDNLKKYVKNFLSVSAPVGITTSMTLNNNQNEYR